MDIYIYGYIYIWIYIDIYGYIYMDISSDKFVTNWRLDDDI